MSEACMREGAHKRIAAFIGRICGLDIEEMKKGSVYPDKVATSFQRNLNPYRIDLGYPHHKNTAERIRTLIFQLRKDRLRGEISPFYFGVLTHFIADKWCYSSDRGNLHEEFERRLENVKIDPGWVHVDIMDASILDTIPYNYPFQVPGGELLESEAMMGAFQESLITVKSIIDDVYPPKEYWNYYIESKKSIKDNSTLYWLLTCLHPLFLLTAFLQMDIFAESDTIKRYAKIKERSFITNFLLGIFGCIIALGSPIFWLCILPIIGYFIAQNFKINRKVLKNIDWYIWDQQKIPSHNTQDSTILHEKSKICPNCGAENLETAKFCIKCGQNMNIKAEKLAKTETAKEWYENGEDLIEKLEFQKALTCFDKALEIDPGLAPAWLGKGTSLTGLGKFKEAIKCCDKAIYLDPENAEAWLAKGNILHSIGKNEEALKCINKALKINPDNGEIWASKGMILALNEEFKEAMECINKAMELDPKNSNVWLSKATFYHKLGDYQEAIKCCDTTIELSDQDEAVASALYYKGVVLADIEAFEEAIKCFEKVLEIIPTDPFAQEGLKILNEIKKSKMG